MRRFVDFVFRLKLFDNSLIGRAAASSRQISAPTSFKPKYNPLLNERAPFAFNRTPKHIVVGFHFLNSPRLMDNWVAYNRPVPHPVAA